MRPKSLSASAAHVFELCPARYHAESYSRTPNSNNSAASLGSAVHEALDKLYKTGLMQDPNADIYKFQEIFHAEYDKLFGDDRSRIGEGWDLCETWWKRTHPITHEILSAEVKESFPITVVHNDAKVTIPFNYIWDRCDRLAPGVVDVVDYKTIAVPLTHDDMRDKLQVRCYALAAQIKYPNENRIWVTYDMLRHGDPVGVAFSRDDNVATYRYLQRILLRILDESENNPTEKINEECRWCIRKHNCESLAKHAHVGGLHGITDPADLAARRMKLANMQSALAVAVSELDEALLNYMKREDLLETELGGVSLSVTAKPRRDIDPVQVKRLVPQDVWDTYGGESIKMGAFDKLLKDDRLDADTRTQLKKLVRRNFSAPSIKTKPVAGDTE